MLDKFRALGARNNQRRRNIGTLGCRHSIRTLIILPACQRSINFTQDGGTAFMVGAEHSAVGVEEIGDRSAFAQKLGVRRDVERLGFSAVAKHYGTYPIAGVDRDSALLD